jgi:hypothetical protein
VLNRSKAWAVTLLVATFVAGAVVGVGGRTLVVRAAYGRAPHPARSVDRLMASLDRELRLTPAQRDSVHAVLERHSTRMAAVWDTIRPRFAAMRAELDSEVIRHLTPDQQIKYRDHVTRYRHQREKTHAGEKTR